MSYFITNITGTPVTGAYNDKGTPSGNKNEGGVFGNPGDSISVVAGGGMSVAPITAGQEPTIGQIPTGAASGTVDPLKFPFDKPLPNNPFRDRLNGASGKSSNSANSLQPFAQGTIAPQINTSIRDGKWDSYNGWNTDPSDPVESGILAIDVRTDVTKKGANNVGADKSTREQTVAFFQGGGTKSQTLHNGGTVDNCDDCPQTLDDETCLYLTEYVGCSNIKTPLDAGSEPDWTRRSIFSGKMPSTSNDHLGRTEWQTGYFYVNDVRCDQQNDITLYAELFVDGDPITESGYEKIDELVEGIGRDCTFIVHGGDVTYAGTLAESGALTTVNNTGYCSGTYSYDSILYETNHLCRNSPKYDLQNVYKWVITSAGATGGVEGVDFEYIHYGLDFVKVQMGPNGCECLQRYTDGFGRRGSVANKWRDAADAIIARSSECVQVFNQVDPQQCTTAGGGFDGPTRYTAWPTGLLPSGSVIASGTVTGYADPYWSDAECDFIVGVREVTQTGARNQAECPDDYQATGPVLEMPIKRLIDSQNIGTLWANALGASPSGSGVTSFCGEIVWMWDGSSWSESSRSETCASSGGSAPTVDGDYNGDVATTQCPCP